MSAEIVVYVALGEEFTYLFDDLLTQLQDELGSEPTWVEPESVATSWCWITIESPGYNPASFKVSFVPAGAMGNTRAGSLISAVAGILNPRHLVALGIAGSLVSELQPGDVLVPKGVDEYLANSATTGSKRIEFVTSGNSLPTDPRLLDRFRMFPTRWRPAFEDWRSKAQARSSELFPDELRQKLGSLISRWDSRLFVGDDRILASGPAVGKGQAFVEWLKTKVDRKFAALEMETAGIYDAAWLRTPAPRVIAIRGISDFGDHRKQQLEAAAKESFRQLAMRNAFALLIRAIRAGLFADDGTTGPSLPVYPRTAGPVAALSAPATDKSGSAADRYVPWEAEEARASQLLAEGQPAVVFAPPRSGKTCFYKSVVHSLGSAYCLVELSPRMVPTVKSADHFLRWVGSVAVRSCGGNNKWLTAAWSSSEYDTERFEELLKTYVLPNADRPVLFAIDDAEKLFRHESHPRLFQRFRHFNQIGKPPWDRFRVLATTGHTMRRLKAAYGEGSFFVHARIIRLDGFGTSQVVAMARNQGLDLGAGEVEQLLEVLGGHPDLTSKILAEAVRSGSPIAACLTRAEQFFEEHLETCRSDLGVKAANAFAQILAQPGLLIEDAVSDELDGLGLVRIRRRQHFLRGSLYRSLGKLL
jgi:nucleoside phosphorylase